MCFLDYLFVNYFAFIDNNYAKNITNNFKIAETERQTIDYKTVVMYKFLF